MKTPSITRGAALICLWPIVAVSAFASHHTTTSNTALPFHSKVSSTTSKHHHQRNHLLHQTTTHHGHNSRQGLHTKQSATRLHLSIPRGGAIAATAAATSSKLAQLTSTPTGAFNAALAVLAASTAVLKLSNKVNSSGDGKENGEVVKKDPKVKSLQLRFLTVFWLLRMADWLQGPYFYQVYASKNFGSATTTAMTWVSRLFLTGFASTALFGPLVGRLTDSYGRKAGTLAFTFLYSLGAYSTKSSLLGVLLLGRVMGGIGTSLLFSAPEAWLVGEAGKEGIASSLGATFGLAYAGDSIVAILAGQMASVAASKRGPTGPFELSVGFLILGGILASFMWKENVAGSTSSGDNESKSEEKDATSNPTIRDAIKVVKSDPKIMLVGSIQALFESAMYIFVLNWPPAVSKAVSSYFAKFAKDSTAAAAIGTPYGTVFSCFMASCLLGSTLFGQLTSSTKVDKNGKSKAVSTEKFAVGMLGLAAMAMGTATLTIGSSTPRIISALTSLPVLSTIFSPLAALCSNLSTCLSQPGAMLSILMLSLFLFESCVGMYFPTIGTLRSKYFPDSHRSVVMNLFGIPLNAMVVTVFLSIEKLGVQGALGVSTTALAVATACGLKLMRLIDGEKKDGESK
mmetsp:Transcript_9603/g.21649  ORF Transcript_9603/g.21649 Transcript_9603/m.21649 type:complete len:628 (-) Transcript_9603:277-2160(-)|eukprot:CAMPEP_0172304546 /NCGR_PEP_ID=MMETSP1058-20130122/5934_1 /TAXON_ID=83371 /ORGANISM="Detonula confervacea, Strain CCMP 353" /LENGTH=627 /DNA_ID=CAMNT_0013015813 /DNA_START=15 /DNA_END=1898 /DNA_ORIENTATION=-